MKNPLTAVAAVLAFACAAAAQPAPTSVAPISTSLPAINSIRPGTIPAGAATTIAIFGLGYLPAQNLEVRWNGAPLVSWSAVSGEPDTQIVAVVPAALATADGAVTVARVANGVTLRESNPVVVAVGTPPSCAGRGAECGAAIGEVPTVTIVPAHTWTPLVAAPAGGLVRITSYDFEALFKQHTFASANLTDPNTFSRIASNKLQSDGRFFVQVPSPAGPTDPPVTAYVQIPPTERPGSVIGFFCSIHNLAMVTPLGGIVVE